MPRAHHGARPSLVHLYPVCHSPNTIHRLWGPGHQPPMSRALSFCLCGWLIGGAILDSLSCQHDTNYSLQGNSHVLTPPTATKYPYYSRQDTHVPTLVEQTIPVGHPWQTSETFSITPPLFRTLMAADIKSIQDCAHRKMLHITSPQPTGPSFQILKDLPTSAWTRHDGGKKGHTWNPSLATDPESMAMEKHERVRQWVASLSHNMEDTWQMPATADAPASTAGSNGSHETEAPSWPIFVKYNGVSTVLPVCDTMSIASLKELIHDAIHIPTDLHLLSANTTPRHLADHMSLPQCLIRKEATLQLQIRGRGGMLDSFQQAFPGIFPTPNRGSRLVHQMNSPSHPPSLMVPPPPPPAHEPPREDPQQTESSEQGTVRSLPQPIVKQGLTSLYNWAEVSGPPGTLLDGQWYVDRKAVCPCPAMVQTMYAIRPWDIDFGDGCTIPSQGALLPLVPESIQFLRSGQTAFWTIPTSNDPIPETTSDTRKRDPWNGSGPS